MLACSTGACSRGSLVWSSPVDVAKLRGCPPRVKLVRFAVRRSNPFDGRRIE